jgi:hypothetical protein
MNVGYEIENPKIFDGGTKGPDAGCPPWRRIDKLSRRLAGEFVAIATLGIIKPVSLTGLPGIAHIVRNTDLGVSCQLSVQVNEIFRLCANRQVVVIPKGFHNTNQYDRCLR